MTIRSLLAVALSLASVLFLLWRGLVVFRPSYRSETSSSSLLLKYAPGSREWRAVVSVRDHLVEAMYACRDFGAPGTLNLRPADRIALGLLADELDLLILSRLDSIIWPTST